MAKLCKRAIVAWTIICGVVAVIVVIAGAVGGGKASGAGGAAVGAGLAATLGVGVVFASWATLVVPLGIVALVFRKPDEPREPAAKPPPRRPRGPVDERGFPRRV